MQAGCQRILAVGARDVRDAARVNGFKLGNRRSKVHAIEALKSRANMIRNCTSDKDASFSGIAQGNAHGAARRRQVS
jgi:hypothetical protein